MGVFALLAAFDVFHHQHSPSRLKRRELYGHVFGADLPAYIIFHAMLGYVLLGVALGALILRLPLDALKRRRWLHAYFGYTWVFGTIWMPVTAIWCVYTYTGWDIVAFYIFSMFA
ncbi:hypothetical protein W97_00764 [Coniosporium apollinis CBS 100218]|uniref:Uncharacterized protein n=1 Tax=Coniosporium apollinis (strain CBS 100218) TaxID=1168221 RepID=R7YIB7_CONA1|nr:uncharacterized protein W97_00764 [Coniosporium apollinis CBS 100218]EON61549.1 hypothetical protein W97_00764 [Coniosporium apollinis CBS 100218]